MLKKKVASLALPAALLALAAMSVATAGPCTYCASAPPAPPDIPWRDDQVLPGLPAGAAAAPAAAAIGDRFLVAFVSDASGLDQVYLAWAEGIGCTWFQPALISTSTTLASSAPALAVTATDLVVVYAREDGVILARHAPLAGWPVLTFGGEDPLSTAASALATNPAIAAVPTATTAHVFVAWEGRPAAAGGRTRVLFKKSVVGGAPGSFTGADGVSATETDLIDATGQAPFTTTDSGSPVLAADSFGAGTTGVSLGFLNDLTAVAPGEKHYYFLRSIDAGTTFWGDAAATPPSPVPMKVDDPAGTIAFDLAIDSSDHGLGGGDNWSFAVWADGRVANNRNVYSDAQAENGGANPPPPSPAITRAFAANFAIENGMAVSRDTVAATCAALGGTNPIHGFAYNVSNRMGQPEISFRRLSLDVTAGIANACGMGGAANATRQLTGQFPAARTAGDAQFPSAADSVVTGGAGGPQVLQLVTWVDSRSGQDEIWWKSTDLIPPSAPSNPAATPAACDVEGFDVTWSAAPDCDVARYVVTFTDPTSRTTTVSVAAPATTASVAGLKPNTLYTIDVAAIDNACLQGPPVTTQATTADCPNSIYLEVVPLVLPRDGVDQCSAPGPNGAGNGQVEPNEILRNIKLRIQNLGRATVSNVTGTVQPNGAYTRGNATSAYPDLGPAGGSDTQANTTDYEVHLDPGGCPMNPTDIVFTLNVTAPPQIPAPVALTYTLAMPIGASCTACDEDINLDNAPIDAPIDVTDACSLGGPGNGDHFPDPGETVNLKLPLENDGTTPATNVNVLSITSPNPLVTIVAGSSAYPDVQPGTPPPGPAQRNLTDFVITLDPAYDCAATPNVQIDVHLLADQRVTQQNIRFNVPTNPAGCQPCGGASCPGTIPEVTQVAVVKATTDVVLSWAREPAASGGYNVWFVHLPQDIPNARRGGTGPVPLCNEQTTPASAETCTHSGAVAPTADPINFYQVRALCGAAEGL